MSMATITGTTTAYHLDPATSTPLQPSILIDALAHIGEAATAPTVSIWPAAPPIPSRLFVHCPNLDPDFLCEGAHIVCSADGVLLLHVRIVCPSASREENDYFIYQYQDRRPLLRRLSKPLPLP
ncbi:hypothetical protein E2562_010484 [Oryza meyeriana var. granulata]|uniref:Uncharacterized protein n=1 Tax=Oryza meyeriana var. granulata TaxID=110450 RepID=A0A6G1F6W6_9ORYZ|nr:hypothetical protein E2562_010484 [Oryza meyeriana var. granulata]